MATVEAVRVQGLREFQRKLKALDRDLPKALRLALNEASQIVVDEAKPRVPKLTGAAKATVKAASTQRSARVQAGGRKAPYFPWLDFGGRRVGRGGGVAVRQFRSKGRFIWFALGERREDVIDALDKALVRVAEQAGLGVTTSRG